MKVRILRSFADAKFGSHATGHVVEMPEGADWLEAGFAEPVDGEEAEGDEKPGGTDLSQYHTGGGWYDLPGLDKKVRREEAEEHLRGQADG